MKVEWHAAVLCFGSMLQVDWQEEARKARRRWLDAHKDIAAGGLLQPALSGTDLEQPLMSGLDSVPEQSGTVFCMYSTVQLSVCLLSPSIRAYGVSVTSLLMTAGNIDGCDHSIQCA
jgi:hypothetical protein